MATKEISEARHVKQLYTHNAQSSPLPTFGLKAQTSMKKCWILGSNFETIKENNLKFHKTKLGIWSQKRLLAPHWTI